MRQSESSFYQPRGQSMSSSPVFATQLDTSRVTNSTSCPNLGCQGQCCKRQTRMGATEGSDWLAILIGYLIQYIVTYHSQAAASSSP